MAKGRNQRKAKAKKSPSPADETPGDGEPFCRGWMWWCVQPGSARKPAKDAFDKLPGDIRRELHVLMRTYRDDHQNLKPGVHYKDLGKGLWELRIKRHNNPYRLIFFRWEGFAVALDVFFKNQQQTPTDLALQRKAQWLANHSPPEDHS